MQKGLDLKNEPETPEKPGKKAGFGAKNARAPGTRKAPRKISPQYLENAALYYLQRYATSVENFRRVMTRKIRRSCTFHKTEPEAFLPLVEDLIARYLRAGLLNDKGFAEARVSSLRRKGLSKKAIHAKLQAKGLGTAAIETALGTVDAARTVDDEDRSPEMTAALTFARKKRLGPFRKQPTADIKQRQKELAAMGRAGFSYEIARAALEYPDDEDDAEV